MVSDESKIDTKSTATRVIDTKPAVTRLWVALQKMSRLREHYAREQTVAGRLTAATTMVTLADEIRRLTADVLAETER